MPRLLALEWNETEARAAVATSRGERVAFEHAFSAALEPGPPDANRSEVSVGEQISAALAAHRLGRIDALVAVSRSDVELRHLSLPPAPDDELPEMVRFQAVREFNALEDDWPLDFLPIDEDPEQPRNVLAATVDPKLVDKIRRTCEAAGVKPTRLILRPCAAASLLRRRHPAGRKEVCLLVDLLEDEADLTVMVEQKVVFVRHARLRGDPLTAPAGSEALVSEIRRTMAAAQNQLGGRRVESVVLCGAGAEYAALARSLGDQLPTPAELFDPLDGLELAGELRRRRPDRAGRFAPLLGMLWDELEGAPHAFDFLNPRRRPEPPSRRRTYVLAGAGAALAVLMMLIFGWVQASRLNADIKGLDNQLKDLDNQVKRAAKTERAAEEIGKWMASEVVWLDKIRWLSENLPGQEDAMLTQLNLSVTAGKRGVMSMDVLLKDVDAIDELVANLNDRSHRVESSSMGEAKSKGHYSQRVRASVLFDLGKKP